MKRKSTGKTVKAARPRKGKPGLCRHCDAPARPGSGGECPSCLVVTKMRAAGVYFPYLGKDPEGDVRAAALGKKVDGKDGRNGKQGAEDAEGDAGG